MPKNARTRGKSGKDSKQAARRGREHRQNAVEVLDNAEKSEEMRAVNETERETRKEGRRRGGGRPSVALSPLRGASLGARQRRRRWAPWELAAIGNSRVRRWQPPPCERADSAARFQPQRGMDAASPERGKSASLSTITG